MRGGIAVAAAAAVAIAAVVAWLEGGDDTAVASTNATPPDVAPRAPAASVAAAPPAAAASDPVRFARWIEERSSLRGVVLDGAWEVDTNGRLHPTLALRRRFDQLLTLVGEATLEDLTAFVAHDVEALAGPLAAQRVLDVWQRYVALQRHAWRTPVDMRERATWAPALAERQRVRREVLGSEVATAFYAQEDAELQALLARSEAAPVPAVHSTAIDTTRLSPQALARLQQEDAAWADWERRLVDARREHAALRARQELSDVQRTEWMLRYLEPRFDAAEKVRVQALLGL